MQVERLALEVGSGLLNGDMVPQRTFDSGTGKSITLRCIGIFAKNREEWVITEHGSEFPYIRMCAYVRRYILYICIINSERNWRRHLTHPETICAPRTWRSSKASCLLLLSSDETFASYVLPLVFDA